MQMRLNAKKFSLVILNVSKYLCLEHACAVIVAMSFILVQIFAFYLRCLFSGVK